MLKDLARSCILRRKDYIPGKPVEEVSRELGITDIIKMASNENPLGTSPLAIEAMIKEIQASANRYPESMCTVLAEKLAKKHGLKPGQFFIDNGGDAVITMVGLTFINPEDEVIYSELTFPAYENITTKMGGVCVPVPLANGCLDLDAFAKAITPRTKLIFVCNPNNPTGTIISDAQLKGLLNVVPETCLVVVDEAYYDFVEDSKYPDSVSLMKFFPNLMVLRTFSKVMGMAGLRVGYLMADEELIKVMLKAREPFPVNRIAQAGAVAALDDKEFYEQTLLINREGRLQYYQAFEEMGLSYYPSQTNFIYVDLATDAEAVFQNMLHDGVIVRPLTSQGRPQAMRITVGLKEENERTIASLKKALGK